jgi:hypothetical protein
MATDSDYQQFIYIKKKTFLLSTDSLQIRDVKGRTT